MVVNFFYALLITSVGAMSNWEDFADVFNQAQFPGRFSGFGLRSQQPAPCCLPKQWQGVVTTLKGISYEHDGKLSGGKYKDNVTVEDSTIMMYVDQTNRRIAGSWIYPITKDVFFSFIMTFDSASQSGAVLYVFNATAQSCSTTYVKEADFKDQCIPKDSKFLGRANVGPAVGGLPANSFMIYVRDKHSEMIGSLFVTPDACLPVVSHSTGNTGSRVAGLVQLNVDEDSKKTEYVSSSYFTDLKASISDPTVFTPPSYCPHAKIAMNRMRFSVNEDEKYLRFLAKFLF